MTTHLAVFFRKRRLKLGLKLGDVARRMGYTSIPGAANRLIRFEERGEIDHRVFAKLTLALQIDQETVSRLVEQDRREQLERWLAWANEPVAPRLVVRLIPGIYSSHRVPAGFTSPEEMERYASEFAERKHLRVCLMPSRRLAIWIDEEGKRTLVEEAAPGEVLGPWMRFRGSGRRFLFGSDGG